MTNPSNSSQLPTSITTGISPVDWVKDDIDLNKISGFQGLNDPQKIQNIKSFLLRVIVIP